MIARNLTPFFVGQVERSSEKFVGTAAVVAVCFLLSVKRVKFRSKSIPLAMGGLRYGR